MKLIIGLGNPGEKYKDTLHNIGFMVADRISVSCGIEFSEENKIPGYAGRGRIGNEEVLLAKPSTYMNESGRAVSWLMNYYGINPADIIVVHDDLDLEAGRIRIKEGGSSAGHRGIASIIEHIKTPDFVRIRIGIGRPPEGRGAVGHVLGSIKPSDREAVAAAVIRAAESVEVIFSEGVSEAMNRYNRRSDAGKNPE